MGLVQIPFRGVRKLTVYSTESNQFAYVKEPFKGKIWRLCTRREDPQLTKGPETYLLVHEETRMCLYRPRYLDKGEPLQPSPNFSISSSRASNATC